MEHEIIKVSNVTMTYKMTDTNIMSFKEWILSLIKKKVQYNKFSPLENVSFSINKGDVLGVIGRNGAGKSTLLKLISGIMKPTEGSIYVGGNIVPMLELGAGFDYDLTGKENIYLNGSILGYRKQFLDSNYEGIIEFSELGEFINMPLRTYSSGMVMRLAFSIAAIVEPDILICDEILSVGDDHFREKSFNRMKEMMSGGTTVIIVSHDISQIKKICNKVLWLDEHRMRMYDDAQAVCDEYTNGGSITYKKNQGKWAKYLNDKFEFYIEDGFFQDPRDGKWKYAKDGIFQPNYTGLVYQYNNGLYYYVRKGIYDITYTGETLYKGKWRRVVDGDDAGLFTGKIVLDDGTEYRIKAGIKY